MSKTILVVDDDELMRTFIATVLREDGYGVDTAQNGKTGLNKIKNRDFDLVITDLKMPDMSGVDLMQAGLEAKSAVPWVIITAYGSINNAVEAMKAGAVDYLTKPFKSPEELRHIIRRVLKEADAEEKIAFLTEELGKQYPPVEMIFLGDKMQKVHEMVRSVAATSATVFIT